MQRVSWVGFILAAGLAGCSHYPIPDDVGYSKTEEIILYARCEMRADLIRYMLHEGLIDLPASPGRIAAQFAAARGPSKKKAPVLVPPPKSLDSEQKNLLLRLARVAVVYAFDFDIREKNGTSASAAFNLPWLTSNALDVKASAALDLTRQGHRVFTSEDTWEDLLVNPKRCKGELEQPTNPANFVYPLTGSIGVGRVVETFISIDRQGGAKDSFVDTLTFTTEVTGGADASVKLASVPDQFRPVAAAAAVSASRLDIHKLTLSLVFPRAPAGGIAGVERFAGDLNAPPFLRSPIWRARYNLCVQDARTRESAFKQLRLTDPLVYCITYADAFNYGDQKVAVTVSRAVRVPATPGSSQTLGAPSESAAPTTRIERRRILVPVPGGRPNYLPNSIQ
jgi:hypothetical protein